MKKLFFLGLLAVTSFSCNEEQNEETKQVKLSKADLEEVASQFNAIFSNTIEHVATQSPLISIYEAAEDSVDIVLEVENIDRLAHDYLSTQYFEGAILDIENIDLEEIINFPDPGTRTTVTTSIVELTDAFSENQKGLLIPFTEEMMTLTDLNIGKGMITEFNNQVIESVSLSDEEKIQLIEYSSGFHAMIGFFENGGTDQVYEKIYGEGSVDGRTLECSIDIRSIWAGAVVGALGNAAWGGFIGATAGSFTVPVLGTAVGGVGGAVFGGAYGFVSGATAAVVGNLLLTCGRATPKQGGYTSASCRQMGAMGLKLPSVCYRNIAYRSSTRNFRTNYKLITEE